MKIALGAVADFKGIPASGELKKAWQEMVEDMNLRGEKTT